MYFQNVVAKVPYIVDKQTELQKTQRRHPVEAKFLHLRLNSLRNYVETQRRQITLLQTSRKV